jgi:hypothetical protein
MLTYNVNDLEPMIDYPSKVIDIIKDNFWSAMELILPPLPRTPSNWYYFSGLNIFMYSCSAYSAIEMAMYKYHPREEYRTCYLDSTCMEIGVFLDDNLVYTVSRAYGPPGIRSDEITSVASKDQLQFTPVPFSTFFGHIVPCVIQN